MTDDDHTPHGPQIPWCHDPACVFFPYGGHAGQCPPSRTGPDVVEIVTADDKTVWAGIPEKTDPPPPVERRGTSTDRVLITVGVSSALAAELDEWCTANEYNRAQIVRHLIGDLVAPHPDGQPNWARASRAVAELRATLGALAYEPDGDEAPLTLLDLFGPALDAIDACIADHRSSVQ